MNGKQNYSSEIITLNKIYDELQPEKKTEYKYNIIYNTLEYFNKNL